MTDQAQQQAHGRLGIQKIYVKDISFETPNSPQIFREKWEPDVSLQLSNNAATLSEGVHEVTLTLTVTAKIQDKTAYLVEVHQAGIFNIEGFEQNAVAAMVGSYCPNILFPYARETVSDIVTRGGFPQLLLAPVNFEALYAQHLEQMKKRAEQAEPVH
jgi:preprotein translocase subunit SecB